MTGSKGEDWEADLKGGSIQRLHIVEVSPAGFYSFTKSNAVYHQEVDRSRVDDIIKRAKEVHRVGSSTLVGTGSDLGNPFINVAHHDSPVFQELSKELRFDPAEIVRIVKNMQATGHKRLGKHDHEAGYDRGALHFNFGYGNRNFDNNLNPAMWHTCATFPEFINYWEDTKGNVDEEIRSLWLSIGSVADVLTDFMDLHCVVEGGRGHFDDEARTEFAGVKFRNAIGASRSRYESATVAVTELGTVDKVDKKHTLKRHTDGPNDSRPGYDITCVFWCIVEVDGLVYRVTVILYSRRAAGNALDNEQQFMAPALTELLRYKDLPHVLDFHAGVREDAMDMEEHTLVLGDPTVEQASMRFLRTRASPSPNGYFSLFVYLINLLTDEYCLPYRRILELFYIAITSNSAPSFCLIVSRWTNGRLELREGETLIEKYRAEFQTLGIEPRNAQCIRMQSCNSAFYGLKGDDMKAAVDALDQVVQDANHSKDFDEIMKDLTSNVPGVGSVLRIQFYSIGVPLGILHTDWAREESMRGRISDISAFGKYLKSQGCNNDKDFRRTIRRLSQKVGKPEYVVENWGCKACKDNKDIGRGERSEEQWDYYLPNQWIFDRSVGDEGIVVVQRRRLNEVLWQNFSPKVERGVSRAPAVEDEEYFSSAEA